MGVVTRLDGRHGRAPHRRHHRPEGARRLRGRDGAHRARAVQAQLGEQAEGLHRRDRLGRRRRLRLRQRRAARHLPAQRLHHRRRAGQGEGAARRALPQPRRLEVRGRDGEGRRLERTLGHGRRRRRLRQRRLRRHVRRQLRHVAPLSQQRQRHVHGRGAEGRRRAQGLVYGRELRRLRQRRPARPLRPRLRRVRSGEPPALALGRGQARPGRGELLPVPRRRRHVRPARAQRRHATRSTDRSPTARSRT